MRSITAPLSTENSPDYLSSNRMDRFRKSYLRIGSSPTNQSKGNILSKTKWAIYDKAKFEDLIFHIKDLTGDIHNIIPISARSQDKMVHQDIASFNPSRLSLVQNACEGTYQGWSDVASAILMASEVGTIDRRSVGEWLQDTKNVEHNTAETAISTDASIGSTLVHKGEYCIKRLKRSPYLHSQRIRPRGLIKYQILLCIYLPLLFQRLGDVLSTENIRVHELKIKGGNFPSRIGYITCTTRISWISSHEVYEREIQLG